MAVFFFSTFLTTTPTTLLLFVLVLVVGVVVRAAPPDDRVHELPLYGAPPTPHYSGYLNATEGCDTTVNGNYCLLHYWYAEAETGINNKEEPHPSDRDNSGGGGEGRSSVSTTTTNGNTAPIVLWLNGGPGSSSLLGMLAELGPLLVNATGDGLMENPYAWTKVANLLVLESPVGTGFSYCEAMTEEEEMDDDDDTNNGTKKLCRNTDKYTATASKAALVDFFTTKFPELKGRDMYITGESYAGVYVPTLSKEVLDNVSRDIINLVGIAVGDPCTDQDSQSDSLDALWYGHRYGLVPDQSFDFLWNVCKARSPGKLLLPRGTSGKPVVQAMKESLLLLAQEEEEGTVMEADVDVSSERHRETIRRVIRKSLVSSSSSPGPDFRRDLPGCTMEHRKFLLSTSNEISQSWADRWVNDYSLFGPGGQPATDVKSKLRTYLLRSDVRKALHTDVAPVDDWDEPSQGFDYTKEYAACNDEYDKDAPSMISFYRDIAPRLQVTWVYNGNTDPCVSYEGTRTAIARVGFNEMQGGSYRPWFYNHTAVDLQVLKEKDPLFGPDLLMVSMGAQFGGEVVDYEHNLSFLTVHGSGHMVPEFRPQAALHMLTRLIEKGSYSRRGRDDEGSVLDDDGEAPVSLSPPYPSNETLSKMTDAEFAVIMDLWTERAKSPPYVTAA